MMKKSEAKTSIFGRGLAARQSSSSPQTSSGIFVHMYGDNEQTLPVDDFGSTFDAEKLCYMAVEKLEITPVLAPLFALARPTPNGRSWYNWCPPNEKILCSEDCAQDFFLRVRFIPPESTIFRLPQIDANMFSYLFQQIRSDFINDRIAYHDKIGQENLLGLGVIDMVRYGKEHKINLTDLRNLGPLDFIPASAKNKFKFFIDKKRLQMNFKPHLEQQHKQFEADTVVNTQLTYIKGIADYAEHYGMETFKVTSSCSGSEAIVAQVKPYDSKFPGLNIYKGKVTHLIYWLCCIFAPRYIVFHESVFLNAVLQSPDPAWNDLPLTLHALLTT